MLSNIIFEQIINYLLNRQSWNYNILRHGQYYLKYSTKNMYSENCKRKLILHVTTFKFTRHVHRKLCTDQYHHKITRCCLAKALNETRRWGSRCRFELHRFVYTTYSIIFFYHFIFADRWTHVTPSLIFILHKSRTIHRYHKSFQQLWQKYLATVSVANLGRRPKRRVTTACQFKLKRCSKKE